MTKEVDPLTSVKWADHVRHFADTILKNLRRCAANVGLPVWQCGDRADSGAIRGWCRARRRGGHDVIGSPSGTTRLVKTVQGFERRFEPDLKEPTQLLVPIGESAASLLCGSDPSRVKECANSACGAFFYNTSKNRGRRWCSGNECGNRMRVAAFYARSRSDD